MRKSRLALWARAGPRMMPGPARSALPAATAVFRIPRRETPPISLSDIMPSPLSTAEALQQLGHQLRPHEKCIYNAEVMKARHQRAVLREYLWSSCRAVLMNF